MDVTPFTTELLDRIARICEQRAVCPDPSGFELAFDRGNITAEEVAAVRVKIDGCQRFIEEETAGIEELAARHAAAFDRFLAESAAQLRQILDHLKHGGAADAFEKRFSQSLLPDLIAGLEARRQRQPEHYAFPWLLCTTVDVLRSFGAQVAVRLGPHPGKADT